MSAVEQKQAAPESLSATMREVATDAIRYWEPRRILYNAVLAAISIGYYVAYLPESRAAVTLERVLVLFMLAVMANLCYCTIYVVDIFAQLSDFRLLWRRLRWFPLTTGIVFAAILTRFVVIGFFTDFIGD